MSADDHPVSDEQIDPVAVVAARLRDLAETTLEFKVGELAEAEQTRDQVKIAEANVAVAKAELGVAKAELSVAKAELGVAKAELVKAKQRGDLNQIADAELGVAKTEVSVAKAELWVAKAEVAVAAPDQQEAAKSVLVQAIRGLSIAQDAQQRALATGTGVLPSTKLRKLRSPVFKWCPLWKHAHRSLCVRPYGASVPPLRRLCDAVGARLHALCVKLL